MKPFNPPEDFTVKTLGMIFCFVKYTGAVCCSTLVNPFRYYKINSSCCPKDNWDNC